MIKKLTIPISAIAKLSKNISRPTMYKIVETRPDLVKLLIKKEVEIAKFYDTLFKDYKKEVYSNRSNKKDSKKITTSKPKKTKKI